MLEAETLVIIDMQEDYDCAKSRKLVRRITRQIRRTKREGGGIIVVEFDWAGKTIQPILKAIGDYEHVEYVIKNQSDGGQKIFQKALVNNFNYRDFKVCGIFIADCIAKSARSLLGPNQKVEVIREACGCETKVCGDSPFAQDSWDIFNAIVSNLAKRVPSENLRIA